MKIIGIVSEYNPFHNGHLHQIKTSLDALSADAVVAVMSGNFVQRGFPAIFDKWSRAEMAVRNGVNLVIELPTHYATSSAEGFAHGAVQLLNATGVVTHLSFGSESESLDELDAIANILISPSETFQKALDENLSKGVSFPVARAKALAQAYPDLNEHLNLNQSNVILVVEYLKALKRLNSNIQPFLVKRVGSGYHDTHLETSFASATAIRKAYFDHGNVDSLKPFLPDETFLTLKKEVRSATRIEDFEKIIFYLLRQMDLSSLSQIREVSEGLENKLKQGSLKYSDYHALVNHIKSKRYTMTRINRILVNVLLGINQETPDFNSHGYFRILGFDAVGQKVIRQIKRQSELPVITNINKHTDLLNSNPLLQLDIKATNLYDLAQSNPKLQLGGRDHLTKPYHHAELLSGHLNDSRRRQND